jgi:NAD(P)-dependent dehydrogenase (short-subunit alcohol dehydrogenase family)
MRWTAENIPKLDGKNILITGANSGLGLVSAKALARQGAHVVLACRTLAKAKAAEEVIRREVPGAQLSPQAVDLADLASVRGFAREIAARLPTLDVLMNNAGVMATPYLRTADGFEMQFGTNHLGHFALTGLLFELLAKTPDARVVTIASAAHRMGVMRFEDPSWEHGYSKWAAYGMSKLANLLFAYELARRCKIAGIAVKSVAAHPGAAATNLPVRGPELARAKLATWAWGALTPLFAQPSWRGALPQLYAAVADGVSSGDYIGPDGLYEVRGYPKKTRSSGRSRDTQSMKRLWELSEQLTGVHYGLI